MRRHYAPVGRPLRSCHAARSARSGDRALPLPAAGSRRSRAICMDAACDAYFVNEPRAAPRRPRCRFAAPAPPAAGRALMDLAGRSARLSDWAARVVVGTLFGLLSMNLLADFVRTHRLTGLWLLISEGLVLVLTVFRRRTRYRRSFAADSHHHRDFGDRAVAAARTAVDRAIAPDRVDGARLVAGLADRDRRQVHARPQLRHRACRIAAWWSADRTRSSGTRFTPDTC